MGEKVAYLLISMRFVIRQQFQEQRSKLSALTSKLIFKTSLDFRLHDQEGWAETFSMLVKQDVGNGGIYESKSSKDLDLDQKLRRKMP